MAIEILGKPTADVEVERFAPGRPHEGKVLAAVQAHADDIPLFCAGAIAKLIDEGYTAYLIQTTNDEKCGPSPSLGETVLINEREIDDMARGLGFEQVFHLGYRNHRLDEASPTELRARLVFLFRHLKVDTVFTFNPWGHGEENPDHWVTGQAVEAARWMAGMGKDYAEHLGCGMVPHTVREQYYWVVRAGQPFNRVVDIDGYIDRKLDAMAANKAQGRRLPALGEDDESADREYIRLFGLQEFRGLGERYGCEYGEGFYYVPLRSTFVGGVEPETVEAYIAANAEAL